ncbi:hypothetical protein DAI22_02g043700 [Oryza sativa Japonica Group]|nr:hypothetical protein DAI22_02g043700 [Oryza sativa Japonica Group]
MSLSAAVAPQIPPASGVLAAPYPVLASATTPAALRACSSRPVPGNSGGRVGRFPVYRRALRVFGEMLECLATGGG